VNNLRSLLTLSAALASLVLAQHPRPVYDPETKEGLLIQHIQQEEDPTDKLHYMEQFVLQFPTNPAMAWVMDQLQPAYMKEKAWDGAMRIGQKRVDLEPENLDAAKLALQAAQTKANQEDIAKWADINWNIASKIAAKGGKKASDAQQAQLYAEYCLFNVAQATTDPETRLKMLQSLQERNPKSPYSENVPAECFGIYKQLKQMDKAIALAEKTLVDQPDNVDMLMAVAEYLFGRQEGRDKIIANSLHLIDVLNVKARPDSLTEEDWQKKKNHLLGAAYYMVGISSSFSGQYGRADQMLRAALPLIVNDATEEASALYELGMANYKLADSNPGRARDALAFWRRCAGLRSNFQAQAMKNADAVRAEFNLPN
jgi:tetratricopeptide (TPR) repeat protein